MAKWLRLTQGVQKTPVLVNMDKIVTAVSVENNKSALSEAGVDTGCYIVNESIEAISTLLGAQT